MSNPKNRSCKSDNTLTTEYDTMDIYLSLILDELLVADQDFRISFASRSPLHFAYVYLPNLFSKKLGLMHWQMDYFLTTEKYIKKAIIGHSKTYKTTIAAIAYLMWEYFVFGRSVVVVVMSSFEAKRLNSFFRNTYRNQLLVDDFGAHARFGRPSGSYAKMSHNARAFVFSDPELLGSVGAWDLAIYDNLEELDYAQIMAIRGLAPRTVVVAGSTKSLAVDLLVRKYIKTKNEPNFYPDAAKILVLPLVVDGTNTWPGFISTKDSMCGGRGSGNHIRRDRSIAEILKNLGYEGDI